MKKFGFEAKMQYSPSGEARRIERVHDLASHVDRLSRHVGCDICRGDRQVENVMAVCVADRTKVRPPASRAARTDQRDFAGEIDERFEYRFLTSKRVPRGECVICLGDRHLSFAVVPQPAVFTTAGQPSCASASRNSSNERTARNGVTGKPALERNIFSRNRSVAHFNSPPTKIAEVVPRGRYIPTANNIGLRTSIRIKAMPSSIPATTLAGSGDG